MSLPTTPPLGLNRFFNKRHAVIFQEANRLCIVLGRCCDGHLQPTNLVYLVVIDLRKDYLLPDTDGVVASSVQSTPNQATEVTDTRESGVHQPIQEMVHSGST